MNLLMTFRNLVWRIRRAWHNDLFEMKRERWLCGAVSESCPTMREMLVLWSFECDHVLQFEDKGQVLSGRWQYDWDKERHCFQRQLHVRFFNGPYGLEVRAHKEYTPEYDPWKHVNAIGVESGCRWFWELYSETKAMMSTGERVREWRTQ